MSVALRPSHLASLSPAAPHPAPILLAHPRRAGHVLPAPSERVRGQARREENSCPSSTATSRHWQRGRPCTPSRLCPATDRVRRHGNRWSNRETRRSQTECTCPPFARRSGRGRAVRAGDRDAAWCWFTADTPTAIERSPMLSPPPDGAGMLGPVRSDGTGLFLGSLPD